MPQRDWFIGVDGINALIAHEIAISVPSDLPVNVRLGILADRETSMGERLSERAGDLYPSSDQISKIAFPHNKVDFFIHYEADPDWDLLQQLRDITELAGPNIRGIQIGMIWPRLETILAYKKLFPRMSITIKIPQKDIDSSFRRNNLTDRLRVFQRPLVDHFLLDPSGGTGTPLDPEWMEKCLEETKHLKMSWIISGGLGPGKQHLSKDLVMRYGVSSTALKCLRTPEGLMDLPMTLQYLNENYELYCLAAAADPNE